MLYNEVKFQKTDFILVDWQDDGNIPLFASITDIIVVGKHILFKVKRFNTEGIDRHFHSFVIKDLFPPVTHYFHPEHLQHYQPFKSHHLRNGNCYITLRSHVEKFIWK